MFSLLYLVYSLFGYSQAECDICGWPWTTGVNAGGECYLTYKGFQGGLQSGCYTYCDAWAREISVQQPASVMLSFANNASGVSCVCQRLNSWGSVEFKTRPTGTCDFGYSDALNQHYDSIAVNWRSAANDSAIALAVPSTVVENISKFAASQVAAGRMFAGCMNGINMGRPGTGDALWFSDADYQYYAVSLPSGKTCFDFQSGALGPASGMISQVLSNQKSQDTSFAGLKSGIDGLSKQLAGNQSAILDALAQLQAKPTGGGGGAEVDLGPVLEAIEESKRAQLDATGAVGDSVGAMGSRLAGRMMSIESGIGGVQGSIDAQGVTLDGIRNEVTGLGGKMAAVGDSVGGVRREVSRQTDTVASVRRAVDNLRGVLDSIYRWDRDETSVRLDRIREGTDKQNKDLGDSVSSLKPYYQRIVDSLRRVSRSTDTVGSRISRVLDSISISNRHLYKIDSSAHARWIKDSIYSQNAYKSVMDSLNNANREGREEANQKLGELSAAAGEGEAASSSFLDKLRGFQSLSGTCSEPPILSVEVFSIHIEYDFNKYPWFTSFLRNMMRFIGGFSGMMVIFSAFLLLGRAQTKG